MRPTSLLLALASGWALGGAAGAQPAAPPSPEPPAMREAHARQRAADLRTVLRLRPDQGPALQAFLAARDGPGRPDGPPPMTPNALSTPERLDALATRQAAHIAATKAFYAALSPDQRQVFDAVTRMRRGLGDMRRQLVLHGAPR